MVLVIEARRALVRTLGYSSIISAMLLCFGDSCSSSDGLGARPALGPPLRVIATVVSKSGGRLTGAVGLENCEIAIADANARVIVVLDADGRQLRRIRVADDEHGSASPLRLDASMDGRALVWDDVPGLLRAIDLRTGLARNIAVPPDPWGLRMPGPAVQLPGGLIALARLGDGSWPRSEPPSHPLAYRVETVDSLGRAVQQLGPIGSRGGRYLTWLSAASALGRAEDTLVVVDLGLALIYRYERRGVLAPYEVLDTLRLPRYFAPQPTRETAARVAGVQGPVYRFQVDRQLEGAAVDGRGDVYAIRSRESAGRYGTSRIDRSLEIYSARGALLGSYRLPIPDVRFLSVSGDGRLVLRGAVGLHSVLIVTSDPLRAGPCDGARYQVAMR